ncbi:hypothetical protein PRIPAC_83783 [Pristionchus pacificus]|uniref:Uncharacterized protein n=1 Tax=Pristionchus pacificus TaxID=54126 RepID=A0A2A6BGQ4_PRIPA|nr:hypothetical protein PRIPAC_83783 [Pristionchus pacificus]|eukprot:PDM65059.1 hypothetical protein PRIPAC_53308 [Pristionchus pacificus]
MSSNLAKELSETKAELVQVYKLEAAERTLVEFKEYLLKRRHLITFTQSTGGFYVKNVSPIALYICFHINNYSEKAQYFERVAPSEIKSRYRE